MTTRYQEKTENLLNKMENYINNNKHWFCVGAENLIQISKDQETNMFKVRTNTGNYNEALENFLNNEHIEFNEWKTITKPELQNIINKNRENISFQFNNFN